MQYHFFRNVEQLFLDYDVPSALQAILIRPFLNEKAKSILEKLSAEILGDYTRLKAALLQEFKLSANVYLERLILVVKILMKRMLHSLQG